MDQYDVSVVIPVYNSEDYIEECVKSIRDQDYPNLNKVQVILINDGSKDNSLEICKQLQKTMTNLNIEIITGENQGISATRNKGIKMAKGRYILFLDSDDFISPNALSKLIGFFDEHYDEIDLVTYPMYEYNINKKKRKILQRYEDYFHETRVYDLNIEYEAIQPTMNIMVKNYYNDNILFDENVSFNEDTLYNTQILMKKMRLGYVKEAQYIYRIHSESTTSTKDNPLYSFNQYMYVFEKLFKTYRCDNGYSPKYIQRLYLNVLRYRIEQDKLLPYHLEGEEWNKAYKRIVDSIKQIQNKTIIQFKQMDKYHKAYLIAIKNDDQVNISKSYDGKVYSINFENKILFNENKIEIVYNRIKLRKDTLYILGYLKSPLLRYKEPEMYLKYKIDKEQEKKIELSEKTLTNRYKTNMEVAKFYKFEIELNIKEIKSFNFVVKIDGTEITTKSVFNAWSPLSLKLKNYKVYFGEYRLQFKPSEERFLIKKADKKLIKKDEKRNFIKYFSMNKRIAIYRFLAIFLRKEKKKIWIYYDRKNVFDNGYEQFKHDIKYKDGIKKYYILDGDIKDYKDKFTRKERKNVIRFGSYKHKILYLNCNKILTSFSSLQEFCPFHKKYIYYKDILKYDLIYLQHGVLHANLLKMYGKEFTPIDKFVISSQFEKNNLINNYGYSKKDLICVGMPRLDKQLDTKEPENKIIFAPSWRNYLIGKATNRERKIDVDKFVKSKYYKETMNFLTNSNLLKVLKDNNIILDYKLHPIFEPYEKCFKDAISQNITVSIGGTDLSKCKAFITDFSSFQFDFVRLARPIIYFMPDLDEFNAGLHTYKKLDLKYEDAFGNLCLTGEDLVKEIVKVINNNFRAEPIFKERMENFFFKVKHRKDRLYDILKED